MKEFKKNVDQKFNTILILILIAFCSHYAFSSYTDDNFAELSSTVDEMEYEGDEQAFNLDMETFEISENDSSIGNGEQVAQLCSNVNTSVCSYISKEVHSGICARAAAAWGYPAYHGCTVREGNLVWYYCYGCSR